jgi:hypothetical protein
MPPAATAAPAPAAPPPGAPVELIKSPSDRKEYRYLKLPNGMAVLLIHDPEIAAAMAAAPAGGAEVQRARGSRRGVGVGSGWSRRCAACGARRAACGVWRAAGARLGGQRAARARLG